MYIFGEDDKRVIVIIYVDDLILASKEIKELEQIKSKLKSAFKMVDLRPIHDILGVKVKRKGQTGSIFLSQEKYVDELLARFNMEDAKRVSTPIEPNIKISKEMGPNSEAEREGMKNRPYRELISGLIYLANATRPDIAFAASTLSRFCTNLGKSHSFLAKHVLRYLKGTKHFGINYTKNLENVTAYTDSAVQIGLETLTIGSPVRVT